MTRGCRGEMLPKVHPGCQQVEEGQDIIGGEIIDAVRAKGIVGG